MAGQLGGGCALCEVQQLSGPCPHQPSEPADVTPAEYDDEWMKDPYPDRLGRERRTLSADEAYAVLERRAWLALAAVTVEVEHYEA